MHQSILPICQLSYFTILLQPLGHFGFTLEIFCRSRPFLQIIDFKFTIEVDVGFAIVVEVEVVDVDVVGVTI
jgi:hypothetical protein